ncbi:MULTISPECIES: cache domain-containing protein [unclassified Synechocystis]|uniref:cache domain-containing protein n=1 Tax=unclassified Synechocystis TaxID=2640012 RepID=UPI000422760F|nr:MULTISPECIES: cache domain-containing protein [unclassified Synechocystis]AIE73636.1 hypothetical protein D082_11080 [Synechocystis sp. PCC 6714]MCT0254996.1 cache domain-containing protein [Synechocystis sp. CS-94]
MQRWRRRFLSYLILACLFWTSLIAFSTYITLRQARVEPTFESLEQVSELKAEQLDHWFDQLKTDFKADLENFEVRKNANILLGKKLNNSVEYQEAYRYFYQYFSQRQQRLATSLITNNGMVIFSTDPDREGQYQPLQNTTTYFKLENIDKAIPNFYQSTINQMPAITLATPLLNQSEKRVGVLTIDLNLSDLDQLMGQSIVPTEQIKELATIMESYLVGRLSLTTNTIVSNNFSQGQNGKNNDKNNNQIPRLESYGIDRGLGTESGQAMYLNHNQIPVLGVYRWLPAYRFVLLVEVEQAKVFDSARHLAGQLFGSGLLLTTVASISLCLTKNSPF